MNPLLMALMQAMQQQPAQAVVPRGTANARTSALARAMAGRKHVDSKAQQAKNLQLVALKPYAESDHADRIGGTPGTSQTGAFQSDAFQNDAFQVDGVV